MIPIIEDFVHRFNLEDFVVVADSGLMNKSNLELLEHGGYKYIIGARVRMRPKKLSSGYFHWKSLMECFMNTPKIIDD